MKFLFVLLPILEASSLSKPRLNRFCQVSLSNRDSYCRDHVSVCHGSDLVCADHVVLFWEGNATIDKFTVAEYDAFCREANSSLSICKFDIHKCTLTLKDCSPRALKKSKTKSVLSTVLKMIAPKNTNSAPASSANIPARRIRNMRVTEPLSNRNTWADEDVGPRARGMSVQYEAEMLTTTPAPAPRVWTTTTDQKDACGLHSAILSHHSVLQGDSYFLLIRDLRKCLDSLKISHGNALWTLHNLRFGVAETYSFTDIMTDSAASEHTNVCGHSVHSVQVDLVREIDNLIAVHQSALTHLNPIATDEYMRATQPAYVFHSKLTVLMNRLHDAHTMYSMPFDMFKVYAPISFGSEMKIVSGKKKQIVTLRMHVPNENNDPFDKLVNMYRRVHGMDKAVPKVEGVGIPDWYAGQEVKKINDLPALDFLLSLVADGGPFAGSFTQTEQRLNAFIFSVPVLSFSPLLGPLPLFDSLKIVMHDMHRDDTPYKVKLMGQFMDRSMLGIDVPNLRSKESLEKYIHNNEVFNSFVKLDTNTQGDVNLLWAAASAAATAGKKTVEDDEITAEDLELVRDAASHWRALTVRKAAAAAADAMKRHKRFTDPVINAMRDNLLVAAMVEGDTRMDMGDIVQSALEEISESAPSSPNKMIPCNSPLAKSPLRQTGQYASGTSRLATSPLRHVPTSRSPNSSTKHSDSSAKRAVMKTSGNIPSTIERFSIGVNSRLKPSSAGSTQAEAHHSDMNKSASFAKSLKKDSGTNVLARLSSVFRFTESGANDQEAGWNVLSHAPAMSPTLCLAMDEDREDIKRLLPFSNVDNLQYLIKDDTMIVRVPSMNPVYKGHADFEMFPEMVTIQNRAKERGIKRLLFDVSGNAGGLVVSAYALQWYVTPTADAICAPLSKRISPHWSLWLDSFGDGLDALLDRHMVTKGSGLASKLSMIFDQLHALTVVIYDGLGLLPAQIGPTKKGGALARILLKRSEIGAMKTDQEKASAIIDYIRSRKFLPPNMPNNGEDLLPLHGFEPFSPVEMELLDGSYRADMYRTHERRRWGSQESKYSKKTVFRFCHERIAKMPDIAKGYKHGYWAEVGFVSDGTCGSACALFLQGI